MSRLPDDLLVCDCAGCSRLLISQRERVRVESTHRDNVLRSFLFVAARIGDRPYCEACAKVAPFHPKGREA